MRAPSTLSKLLDQSPISVVREIAYLRQLPTILVGGAVRDALFGLQPKDFDFSVQGNAINLARRVADALDAAFYVMDSERGIARVILADDDADSTDDERRSPTGRILLDFVTCRNDSWHADLNDRDFTLNAIAVELNTNEIIDPSNGILDLSNRVIRAVKSDSILNDPVRAIRGVRLAHAFDSTIEPTTWSQIQSAGAHIHRPSPERVRDAFMDVLKLERAAPAIVQLVNARLLTKLLPELEPMRGCEQSPPHTFDVFTHTMKAMQALDDILADWQSTSRIDDSIRKLLNQLDATTADTRNRLCILRLAALLHDCGKPATRSVDLDGRIRFFGHEKLGANMMSARANALKLSGDEVSQARLTVANHMRPNQMSREPRTITPRAIYRYMRDTRAAAPEIALLSIADCIGKSDGDDCAANRRVATLLIERYYETFAPDIVVPPLINGKDVIDLGVEQGKRIGELLSAVREAQMSGEIRTREEALSLARSMIVDR
jgi:putative nucleotidyltransferase with HDIG domain